ncbi:hypothetical protein DDE01_11550 [Desulfovibrio desulfuricans]|nr:hypothetical protein DDE01_11550 [Desulfovibrio desulfuricans]
MTRPASVDALFAGHTLPKSKAALDSVRRYILMLEESNRLLEKAAVKPVPWDFMGEEALVSADAIPKLLRVAAAAPYALSECDHYRYACAADIRQDEDLEELREALQELQDDFLRRRECTETCATEDDTACAVCTAGRRP